MFNSTGYKRSNDCILLIMQQDWHLVVTRYTVNPNVQVYKSLIYKYVWLKGMLRHLCVNIQSLQSQVEMYTEPTEIKY